MEATAKRGWRISGVFLARRGITSFMVFGCSDGWIRSFLVCGLVSVALWSGLRGPQISSYLIFTCGDTRKPWCVPGKVMKHESAKGTHLKCNILHNTRCINVSSPWMGELHPCFQSNGNHIEHILWIKLHFIEKY